MQSSVVPWGRKNGANSGHDRSRRRRGLAKSYLSKESAKIQGVMNAIYNTQFDDPTSAMDSDFTDYTLLGRKKRQADFGNYDDSSFGSFGDAGASPQYDWSGSNSGRGRARGSFGMGGMGQGSQSYPGMRPGGQDRFGPQQSGPQGALLCD